MIDPTPRADELPQPPPGTAPPFPWAIPAPVRTSQFVALEESYSQFNVEVALSRIHPFQAVTAPMCERDLLYVDLQDNPVANQRGRLGAGRAGFYRGKYLKGVGRTQAAGNWNDGTDLDHTNGALLATGGIREYLVSVYLQSKRLGDIINGAESVLARPLSPRLRSQFRDRYRNLPAEYRAAHSPLNGDRSIQTLTVKDAPFARFSNLIWLLNHLDFGSHSMLRYDEYFRLFAAAFGHPHYDSEMLLEPESLLAVMDWAIEKTVDNFRRSWSVGVFWGSVHNNFAMDGRFLDLEFPVILGAPLPGIVSDMARDACDVPSRSAGTGLFEVVRYIRHVRAAYFCIMGRLEAILWSNPSSLSREYCAELLFMMRRRKRSGHPLFSSDYLNQTLWQWVSGSCEIESRKRKAVRDSIGRACRAQLPTNARKSTCQIPVRPLSLKMARLGFVFRPTVHVLDGVRAASETFSEGAFVNELIDRLDHETDADRLLSGLRSAADEIRRECSIQASG